MDHGVLIKAFLFHSLWVQDRFKTVANCERKGMQKQKRRIQETIVQLWGHSLGSPSWYTLQWPLTRWTKPPNKWKMLPTWWSSALIPERARQFSDYHPTPDDLWFEWNGAKCKNREHYQQSCPRQWDFHNSFPSLRLGHSVLTVLAGLWHSIKQ